MAKTITRVLLLLVVLAGLAGGGYYLFITSPFYAVKAAADAVHDHSVERFHKWVDVRSVAGGAVEDLMAQPIRQSGAGILARALGLTVVSVFEPSAVDSMQDQIDHWVAHHGAQANANGNAGGGDDDDDEAAQQPHSFFGKLVQLVKPPTLKQMFHEYGLTKKNFRGIRQTQASDGSAHVMLDFYSPKLQNNISIDLELNKSNGQWVITRIANLQDLVAKLSAP